MARSGRRLLILEKTLWTVPFSTLFWGGPPFFPDVSRAPNHAGPQLKGSFPLQKSRGNPENQDPTQGEWGEAGNRGPWELAPFYQSLSASPLDDHLMNQGGCL